MANSSVSLWFDLYHSTGTAEAGMAGGGTPDKGIVVHHAPVSTLVIENVYFGDFNKSSGVNAAMGFWEWIPRCLSDEVCGYPLPKEWSKTVRGGWHWELDNSRKPKPFVALAQDKPLGRKIGAINNFKVEDFKGYDPKARKTVAWKFNASYGNWHISDGKFGLSGNWQFVNLIYR